MKDEIYIDPVTICPDCLQIATMQELATFGGICEQCNGMDI